ncbi:hypothetical protein ACKZDW_07785 [Ralstonia syzygii subsp. celebesensis]|nr:hypothetical protein [Ralstonia syzygii]CCA82187.1 hypothetical protein BDB_30004 [blood disease bacterium R229]
MIGEPNGEPHGNFRFANAKPSMRLSLTGFLVGILSFGLAGCATAPRPAQPVEVSVPVAVPCKAPVPERPAFAVDALPIGSGIWEQMKALRAERFQRKGYEAELEAAVNACQ